MVYIKFMLVAVSVVLEHVALLSVLYLLIFYNSGVYKIYACCCLFGQLGYVVASVSVTIIDLLW